MEDRHSEILKIERAGGLSMGFGLGPSLRVTHTIGKSGEGEFASFVVLTIVEYTPSGVKETELAFDPTYAGNAEQLLGSLRYHCEAASRIREDRR